MFSERHAKKKSIRKENKTKQKHLLSPVVSFNLNRELQKYFSMGLVHHASKATEHHN
jgi:hypothetical protein